MKEIKVRAWDATNKKLYYSEDTHWHCLSEFIFDRTGKAICHIFHPCSHAHSFAKTIYHIEEINDVEMWTGRNDKNTVPIYEGDILRRMIYPLGAVSYYEYYLVKSIDEYIDNGEEFGHFKCYLWGTECEVVGNIHENPEMLKE